MRRAEARRDATRRRLKRKESINESQASSALSLSSSAVLAIVGAGLLAAWSLRNQANYFYLPEQMATTPPRRLGRRCGWAEWCKPDRSRPSRTGLRSIFLVTGNTEDAVPVRY